jgi:hypothetical protein
MALMQVNSKSIGSLDKLKIPNPDKLEKIATKAPRHKGKMIIIKKLGGLVAKIFC